MEGKWAYAWVGGEGVARTYFNVYMDLDYRVCRSPDRRESYDTDERDPGCGGIRNPRHEKDAGDHADRPEDCDVHDAPSAA